MTDRIHEKERTTQFSKNKGKRVKGIKTRRFSRLTDQSSQNRTKKHSKQNDKAKQTNHTNKHHC